MTQHSHIGRKNTKTAKSKASMQMIQMAIYTKAQKILFVMQKSKGLLSNV